MNKKFKNKKNGFTMIEMLVAVAIFAIVITMIMGTIVTIVDASRKSRTMSEVMNNLNFSFESMTRTLKTAKSIDPSTGGDTIIAIDQNDRRITYKFYDSSDNNHGGIEKQVDEPDGSGGYISGTPDPITAADLKLSSWKIDLIYSGSGAGTGGNQPRVFFSVKGRVETAKGIYSEFDLQSTVSQRQLQL
jgi:prepilin-type N-terminal cleavage/methylation domain-containing protein